VIWVGVQAPPELGAVQSSLESRLAVLGYAPEERPFSPHLTLGRVARTANYQDAQAISDALQKMKIGFLGTVRVNQVNLYRSDLHPNGAEYTQMFATLLAEKHA
jgi:2'-5' RNA ligase